MSSGSFSRLQVVTQNYQVLFKEKTPTTLTRTPLTRRTTKTRNPTTNHTNNPTTNLTNNPTTNQTGNPNTQTNKVQLSRNTTEQPVITVVTLRP